MPRVVLGRFQPLQYGRRGSGRRAWQRLTPCASLSNSITGTGGEMPADERINSAASTARQTALTRTTSTVAAVHGMHSARHLLARQSRLLAAAVAQGARPRTVLLRFPPASAARRCRWRRRGVADKVHVHAIARARQSKRTARLQVERRRRLQPTRRQTHADASRATAEIQL